MVLIGLFAIVALIIYIKSSSWLYTFFAAMIGFLVFTITCGYLQYHSAPYVTTEERTIVYLAQTNPVELVSSNNTPMVFYVDEVGNIHSVYGSKSTILYDAANTSFMYVNESKPVGLLGVLMWGFTFNTYEFHLLDV